MLFALGRASNSKLPPSTLYKAVQRSPHDSSLLTGLITDTSITMSGGVSLPYLSFGCAIQWLTLLTLSQISSVIYQQVPPVNAAKPRIAFADVTTPFSGPSSGGTLCSCLLSSSVPSPSRCMFDAAQLLLLSPGKYGILTDGTPLQCL